MKLYAICLVKNEDDVISQTLTYAMRYCDKIFVIDNGSTDRTWEIVQSLAGQHSQIVQFLQTLERFDDALRWLVYDAHHHELTDADWWMILDGDEFLAEDPRPVIQQAMTKRADIVHAWQIQFYYTEEDHVDWVAGRDSRDLPIFERRRYYRIDWQEPRLFRNQSSGTWETSVMSRKGKRKGKVCRRRIFNRHYQYRDPVQIEKRLQLRYGQPAFTTQVDSIDWRSKMRSSKGLNIYKDGEPWRFSFSGLAHCYVGWLRYVIVSRFLNVRNRLTTLFGAQRREPS